MVKEILVAILNDLGLVTLHNQKRIEEPVITDSFWAYLNRLDEYKLPQNLVKVSRFVVVYLDGTQGMNEDILNFIYELNEKCDEGVHLRISETYAFTQSDWDFLIENVINNSSLKFGEYMIEVYNKNEITLNLNTDRKLFINLERDGSLILKGKMGDIDYSGHTNKLRVEGEVKNVFGNFGQNITHQVFNYENLPDIYESLAERLRRLTS